jgi:glycosyltransferase involved in cell wall biosynthesis
VSQKIKILHIIKSLGRGGAEMLLPETLKLHNREQFEFHYIYFLPWKNQMVSAIEEAGGKVTCLEASNNMQIMLKTRSVVRYIRENNIQLIHCHLPWAGIVGRWAARLTSVPVLYTEHNNFFTYNRITRMVHRFRINWFRLVIAVSDDAAKALREGVQDRVKIRTVLNGVNTDRFDPKKFNKIELKQSFGLLPETKVISTVAVFRKQKRLDRWLTIAKQLVQHDSSVRLIIMGDGPLRKEIMALAEQYQLTNTITFTGLIEDPRPYLACTDIYLMSSDFEGLPIALLEAMSMTCVPVVTEVGGIPSVVKPGTNGFLYKPEDTDEAIRIVSDLIKNQEMRIKLGKEARNSILQSFSMNRMVHELEEIYKETVNEVRL